MTLDALQGWPQLEQVNLHKQVGCKATVVLVVASGEPSN